MATPKTIVTMSDNNALPNPEKENKVNTIPGKSKAFIDKHKSEKIDKTGAEESQFTADKIKKDDTKKASYHTGEDAKVYEETMSGAEKEKREKIVKGMKKNSSEFKNKYGDRWKSVMYAVATKNAMKEEVELEEGMPSSVAKSKQKYADMSDNEFAEKHAGKSETELKAMAWRHGYGKDSDVYVNKAKKGSKMAEETELDEATLSAKAARAGKDLGAPGKNFDKIADKAAKRYGSKEAGERVAGAILAKMRKEEVEQVDEIAKSTLGSYATKALRRGDIAARMSHSDSDDMGKIANKRLAGAKKAVDKIAPKAVATRIKANIDKARESAKNRYSDKDDQGKAYYAAQKGISKIREEAEVELLNRLYESLNDSNKKIMEIMIEDGRENELLEFAMERFDGDL